MKPVLLAIGLFFVFLVVRSTLTMSAQGILERPQAAKVTAPDTRARRLAALEAQDHNLAMRQREVELELERIAESQRKVQNQIERESVTPDEVEGSLEDMTADRMQLLQKKAEVRQELERVLAERQRIHEDFQGLTGMRIPGH